MRHRPFPRLARPSGNGARPQAGKEQFAVSERPEPSKEPFLAEREREPQAEKKEEAAEEKAAPLAGQQTPPLVQPQGQPVQPQKNDSDEPSDEPFRAEIEKLCGIAFQKGLDQAIEEAKKSDNPYILDEFHDTLIDQLYKQLIERGRLEQR